MRSFTAFLYLCGSNLASFGIQRGMVFPVFLFHKHDKLELLMDLTVHIPFLPIAVSLGQAEGLLYAVNGSEAHK